MLGRRARYVLDILLLVTAVVVILTGLYVDRLDLHDFAPHRWAGYVVAVLIAIHAGLHWRWFISIGFTNRPRGAARSAVPPKMPSASGAGRFSPSRRAALTAVGAGALGAGAGWFAKARASPVVYQGGDVGLFYHEQSSLGLPGLLSDVLDWGRRPAPYKEVGDGENVPLPRVDVAPAMSVAQALEQRRSFASTPTGP